MAASSTKCFYFKFSKQGPPPFYIYIFHFQSKIRNSKFEIQKKIYHFFSHFFKQNSIIPSPTFSYNFPHHKPSNTAHSFLFSPRYPLSSFHHTITLSRLPHINPLSKTLKRHSNHYPPRTSFLFFKQIPTFFFLPSFLLSFTPTFPYNFPHHKPSNTTHPHFFFPPLLFPQLSRLFLIDSSVQNSPQTHRSNPSRFQKQNFFQTSHNFLWTYYFFFYF